MENLIDTLMNIFIFVFIGLMIWLYAREVPDEDAFPENNDPSQ